MLHNLPGDPEVNVTVFEAPYQFTRWTFFSWDDVFWFTRRVLKLKCFIIEHIDCYWLSFNNELGVSSFIDLKCAPFVLYDSQDYGKTDLTLGEQTSNVSVVAGNLLFQLIFIQYHTQNQRKTRINWNKKLTTTYSLTTGGPRIPKRQTLRNNRR